MADSDIAMHCTVVPARLPDAGEALAFEADAAQKEALAERLDVIDVRYVMARLHARPGAGGGARVEGTVEAGFTQTSVVSLEPIETTLAETLDLDFIPQLVGRHGPADMAAAPGEVIVDPEAEDPPETFSGDSIDLGPYIAEALALGLDPYPREAEADPLDKDTDPDPEGGRQAPFAALAKLKTSGDASH